MFSELKQNIRNKLTVKEIFALRSPRRGWPSYHVLSVLPAVSSQPPDNPPPSVMAPYILHNFESNFVWFLAFRRSRYIANCDGPFLCYLWYLRDLHTCHLWWLQNFCYFSDFSGTYISPSVMAPYILYNFESNFVWFLAFRRPHNSPAICDGLISVLSVISCVPPVASVTLRDAERCVT